MLERVVAHVRGIATRRRVAAEVDDELAFHLEHEIAANIGRGMPPAEARRVALASLGGVAQTAEAIRDVRTLSIEALWRDVRHAVRSLRATPAFTVVALAVLTLSIGASTAIFSIVDGVVLRALPFPGQDRLVAVGDVDKNQLTAQAEHLAAPQNFIDWDAQQSVFTDLAAIGYAGVSLRAEPGQDPEVLNAQSVTPDFFSVLGVQPLLGRPFTPANQVAGRARVAVISYSLWQRRFGGAPDVLDRPLPGVQGDFEILGVMPPGFAYPVGAPKPTEVWLPIVFQDDERVRANSFGYRLRVIGRLRDGVSIGQAQAQMEQIFARLAAETPRWFTHRAVKVEPLQEYLTRGVRTWMLMLLAAVACVLLIACVNLANLMLVRASARSRELMIRSALGASRWDLARALLVESLLLSVTGAALGAALAWLAVDALRAAIPAEVPRIAAITVDLRILGVTMIAAVVTGVIFGAAPLAQLSQFAADRGLMRVTRGSAASPLHQRLRAAFLVTEVALATILLVGSGLFLASFARVSSVNLGLDPRSVLSVYVRPMTGAHNAAVSRERNRGLLRAILDSVRTIPGVEQAALIGGGVPLRGDLRTMDFDIPGRQLPPNQDIDYNEISADYFRVMRIPLLAGRAFDDNADREASEPVVIINEAAAQKFFPGENPVGQMVDFVGRRRIVGVVGSVRHDGPETNWRRQGYVPIDQTRAFGATLMLRLSRDPGEVLPAIKTIVWSQFPGIPMPDVEMLSTYLAGLVAPRRFNMLLLNLFGVMGIVIACVGIYGVMAYTVALRTNEIGIRLALGAVPAVILRSVLGRAATYLGGGLAIGLLGAWLLASLVAGFLFEVEPHDLSVYASVGAVLIVTGLLAAFLPARRASRVDPLIALRLD
jgi:putative ABC transport system permease protein